MRSEQPTTTTFQSHAVHSYPACIVVHAWNILPVMLASCALVCSLACLVNSSSFIWPIPSSSKSKSAACGDAGVGGSGLGGAIGDLSLGSLRSKVPGTEETPIPFSWSSQVFLANLTLTFLVPYILLDFADRIVQAPPWLWMRVRRSVRMRSRS